MKPALLSGHALRPAAAALAAAALAAAALAAASVPGPMTLEAALDAALRENLRLAEVALESQRRELDLARAGHAFDTDAGPFVRISDDRQIAYGFLLSKPLRAGGTLGSSATAWEGGDRAETVLSLEFAQPLFRRFGRGVAEEPVYAASDQLRAARRQWELRKSDLALQLAALFETLARLDTQAVFERDYQDRLDRLAALLRARERQGRATRADVLRVEVRRGEAEARLTNTLERRAAAMRDLAEAIGSEPGATLETVRPPRLDRPLPDSDSAVAVALQRRLELAQAQDDATTAARREALADRSRLPDVALTLTLRRALAHGGSEATREDRTQWLAGLASAGFGSRRTDLLDRQRAGLDETSARLAVERVRRAIVHDVLQALAECRRAETEKEIAARTRDLADHGARVSRRLYALGRTDGWSLETAEVQLAEAEIRLFDADSADRISRYTLRAALGTLVEPPADLTPARREDPLP